MDNTDKNLQATADPAEAEQQNSAAAELGKFKDVRALLEAYNSLEAEFTRRSQRLKELENANKEPTPPDKTENDSAPSQGLNNMTNLIEAARSSDEVKNAIISDYLANASKNRGVPFITGGINVAAQRRVPSSIKEAGRLAEQFFNKREN